MLVPDKVDQRPLCPLLIGQGSLYNLTFDEINSQLGNVGKPLSAMNLFELVKNVISIEEGNNLIQSLPSSASSSSSSSSASAFLENFNLNKGLSKKTIDEVWGEIVDQVCANDVNGTFSKRQLTLGGTTLEEFLVRAGILSLVNQENLVSNPQPLSVIHPMMLEKQQEDWTPFKVEHFSDRMPIRGGVNSSFQVSDIGYDNQVFEAGYIDNQPELPIQLQRVKETFSGFHLGGERKKRLYTEEVMKKSIERRQKRMIKNRESAARSRARKQAYTKQLETDAERLKETNISLRRRKELQLRLYSNFPSGPKYQLRRTSSAEL